METRRTSTKAAGGQIISPEAYAFLQAEIYRDSGIVLDETKSYLMEARLTPLLQDHRLHTIDQLCLMLKSPGSRQLRRLVIEAMTTNETLFFRDANAFEALQYAVLPSIVQQNAAARRIRIWSAASSSGQEAYSLAMLLREMGLGSWDLRIVGTDLNQQMLERARTGRYLQIEVNRGLPARYLARYFEREGLDWRISPEIRAMVDFIPFDLRASMAALGPFDLVLCRNVLIYFDIETKRKILGEIARTLLPGGLILLGCAESNYNLTNLLTPVTHGSAIFYKAA